MCPLELRPGYGGPVVKENFSDGEGRKQDRAFPPWALIAVYLYMCVLWLERCATQGAVSRALSRYKSKAYLT
jgi:hypothetical protein